MIEGIIDKFTKRKYKIIECCEVIETAFKFEFLIIRNGEIVFNLELRPEKAGNLETGEEYDPNDFLLTLAIEHCPFCGLYINIMEDLEK